MQDNDEKLKLIRFSSLLMKNPNKFHFFFQLRIKISIENYLSTTTSKYIKGFQPNWR